MKILFISNFMNHHQKDFCDYLYNSCDEFFFVSCSCISDETIRFGYEDFADLPYVVSQDTMPKEWVPSKVLEADVVIFGDSSYKYLERRMEQNKLSFIFSERMWKKGYYRRFIPVCRRKVTDRFTIFKNKNLFALAASCYLSKDLEMIGFPPGKCFTWGYFTPFEYIEKPYDIYNEKKENSIIWAGRMIRLKHLEELLKALGKVKRDGYVFTLSVIGDGPEKENFQMLAQKLGISENVTFEGSMPSSTVREQMKKAQIFVSTSDFNEGWGAVVNEGMNSVCAPIVSHAVGSSGFLIKNEENGLIYRSGDVESLKENIELLLTSPNLARECAVRAYTTIATEFNGFAAGERFLNTTLQMLKCGKPMEYAEGPMSISPLLKNNWIRR